VAQLAQVLASELEPAQVPVLELAQEQEPAQVQVQRL
jgi:hypothetical protein